VLEKIIEAMYTILQVIISIVVVYLIFSTVVNVIVEGFSGILQLRGKLLKKAILHLFENSGLGLELYNHPRIKSLIAPDQRPPAYIPATSISSALIEIIATSGSQVNIKKGAYENFLTGLENLQPGYIKTLLATFVDRAEDIKSLAAEIEKWFNDSMDRVTGWYKRKTKTLIVFVAVVVTVGCNVDTIHIIRSAQADPVVRQRLNDLGDKLIVDSVFVSAGIPTKDTDYYEDYVNDESVEDGDTIFTQIQDKSVPGASMSVDDRIAQLQYLNRVVSESNLPIGWTNTANIDWLFKVLGWLLTVFALSAGAPFWFDVLKKFVNIRTTGPKPIANK